MAEKRVQVQVRRKGSPPEEAPSKMIPLEYDDGFEEVVMVPDDSDAYQLGNIGRRLRASKGAGEMLPPQAPVSAGGIADGTHHGETLSASDAVAGRATVLELDNKGTTRE